MVHSLHDACPLCGGMLKHRGYVKRKVRGRYGKVEVITLERGICTSCRRVHRVLTDQIIPYFRYDKEVIYGVLEGLIDTDTLGFEDAPNEVTMKRWLHSQCLDSKDLM